MGILNTVRNELLEIIEWVEHNPNLMLWKFPDEDREIKNGAKLIVRESQVALFLNEGKIADVFGPGTHTLSTANIPVLSSIRGWKYGFESPFKADVYFLSTKQFTGLKWGTPAPVLLRDPQFQQVRVRAFGTYFIKIKDAALFFREYAGTFPQLTVEEWELQMRDIIAPRFGEALSAANISVLDVAGNVTALGDTILPYLQKDFNTLGIDLTKFQITSATLPEEVSKFYDQVTGMNMVTDMNRFQQFQMANAIGNPTGNDHNAAQQAMQLGMGMAMANNMAQQLQQQQPAAQPAGKDDIIKLLKELGDLKNAGILTDEEFNAKKKELLAKL